MAGSRIYSVAIALFETDFRRDLCGGIVRFARRRPDWRFEMNGGTPYVSASVLRRWKGDGLIGIAGDESDVELLSKPGCPVVSVARRMLENPFPTVTSDNKGIGRLVAEHFLDLGLRNFAYFGNKDAVAYSRDRYLGFIDRLHSAGVPERAIHVWGGSPVRASSTQHDPQRAAAALKQMPLPLGVFCENDGMGTVVLRACRITGLEVPNAVAVVGCDNDTALCEMQFPALTSVERNTDEMGYRAAELLQQLMDGAPPPTETVTVPLKGMVQRQSSDMLAVPDAEVAAAIRFIRNHAGEDISVDDVVGAVILSRRVLEIRFKKHMGRTIHQEIRRAHIARARQLVLTTDLSMTAVARQCGFNHTSRFRVAFRDELGMSPREFVRRNKSKQTG